MGTVELLAVMKDILSLHSSSICTTSLKLLGIKKQIEGYSANSHSFHLRVPKQYKETLKMATFMDSERWKTIRANIMWDPRLDLTQTHQAKNYYK